MTGDNPLAKRNAPLVPKENVKNFSYVCQEMQAAVSAHEWFKTLHNEWLQDQKRRLHTAGGNGDEDD